MGWKLGFELPKSVYHQTLWFIRDYDRMVAEAESLIEKAHVMDGQPRGTDVGDPVGQAAIRRAELLKSITAIDRAFSEIPAEYRRGVRESIMYGCRFPGPGNRKTWAEYRRRVVYFAAVYSGRF